MRSLLIAATIALAAPFASGQTAQPIILYPPQNDTVSLSLALEDWVPTTTARTELSVDAALPGGDAGKVRGEVLNAVKGLVAGVEWRFTSFDRNQDSSGLEHWHAVLEARLLEAQLGGLSERAKQASKPGMQIAVQAMDFSPTSAEVEAAKAKLRGDMYKKINEALAQLNQAEPDRKFRIQRIDFGLPAMVAAQRGRVLAAAPAQTYGSVSEPPVELSEKVQLDANVSFAAISPRE